MKKDCKIYTQLKKRLQHMGIGPMSKCFKNSLSPLWWESSMAGDESLCLQLALSIAKRICVPVKSLIEDDVPAIVNISSVAYKIPLDKTSADVAYSTALLSSVSDIVTSEFSQSLMKIPPENIRKKILEKNPWVNFYALLDFCWEQSISVFHVSDFPDGKGISGWLKPAAVTIRNKKGYVVFLCTEHYSQAHFVFELAHELGHIMLGHLSGNAIHVDAKTDFRNKTGKNEEAANLFAEKLLGTFDLPECASPESLACTANIKGRENHVDPGHLALHYGFQHQKYSFGESALSIIEQKKERNKKNLSADLIAMINAKAFSALNLDEMKPDDVKFLCGLTGIIQEPVK